MRSKDARGHMKRHLHIANAVAVAAIMFSLTVKSHAQTDHSAQAVIEG
jgi:hypothetical protein